MREKIIAEIRRYAELNGGEAPGQITFEKATGISPSAWRGKIWARWGDAIRDAGLSPNTPPDKLDKTTLLMQFAIAMREFSRVPTESELRMYRRANPGFPSETTFLNRFGGKRNIISALRQWLPSQGEFSDLLDYLPPNDVSEEPKGEIECDGWVYLLQTGANYKIGRGEELEKRVKQIQTNYPDPLTLVHAIKTDDPVGIERYWHQ